MKKVPPEKITKSLTLVCDRCSKVLSQSEPGFFLWCYDEENDSVLCPVCVAELKEIEINHALEKVNSFIEGAKWALSEFYDEIGGTQPPLHMERDIRKKQREMIIEAVHKVEFKFRKD